LPDEVASTNKDQTAKAESPAPARWSSHLTPSVLISVGSFMLSLAAFYFSSIYYRYDLFVAQQGNGIYLDKKVSALQVSTADFAHFSFINGGTRPILVEDVYLVVFQPGSKSYDPDELREYTEGPSGNAFDGVHCQGDMTVVRFDFPAFQVRPGDIEIKLANFQSQSASVASKGADQVAHTIMNLDVTPENRQLPTLQFVYCFSIKLRLASGERIVANRPAWNTSFKRAAPDSDALSDLSFDWLGGLDKRVLDRQGTKFF
jgi:hypothetical protein